MYKYLSILLCVLLIGGAIYFGINEYKNNKKFRNLNNELAKVEGVVQETETVSSRRALFIEDLESSNKELKGIIDDKDEEILAQANIKLKWKNLYFNAKAKQSRVSEEGKPLEEGEEGTRDRVDFEHEEPPLKVVGYTLTNPAFAELKLEWTEDLELELNLTKNADGSFRIYVDPNSKTFHIADITLKVDPTLLEMKWYELIAISADVAGGPTGGQLAVRVTYDITTKWFIGPHAQFALSTDGFRSFYGVTFGFYPFRKTQ